MADRLAEWLTQRAVLHADETPVAQLAPDKGKTKRAYLWTHRSTSRRKGCVMSSSISPKVASYRDTFLLLCAMPRRVWIALAAHGGLELIRATLGDGCHLLFSPYENRV